MRCYILQGQFRQSPKLKRGGQLPIQLRERTQPVDLARGPVKLGIVQRDAYLPVPIIAKLRLLI